MELHRRLLMYEGHGVGAIVCVRDGARFRVGEIVTAYDDFTEAALAIDELLRDWLDGEPCECISWCGDAETFH